MERAAFEDAVERYRDMVYRVAFHALASPADAEDAMQETFLRLFGCGRRFESDEHLRRWLLRVTVNVCRDLLKSRWRRRTSLDEAAELPAPEEPADREVFDAVMRLPEKYRTVLDLFYFEELSTAEIAAALGLRQSAVTTRLSRARELLKERLKEEQTHD